MKKCKHHALILSQQKITKWGWMLSNCHKTRGIHRLDGGHTRVRYNFYKGNAKCGVSPRLNIKPCDLDLWPWKSIRFQILLRSKYVQSLVKIHWQMLILVFTRMLFSKNMTPWPLTLKINRVPDSPKDYVCTKFGQNPLKELQNIQFPKLRADFNRSESHYLPMTLLNISIQTCLYISITFINHSKKKVVFLFFDENLSRSVYYLYFVVFLGIQRVFLGILGYHWVNVWTVRL